MTAYLTAAQKRALDWLPSDGSWKTNSGRLRASLNSLSLSYPGYVELKFTDNGEMLWWRLSEQGLSLKKND